MYVVHTRCLGKHSITFFLVVCTFPSLHASLIRMVTKLAWSHEGTFNVGASTILRPLHLSLSLPHRAFSFALPPPRTSLFIRLISTPRSSTLFRMENSTRLPPGYSVSVSDQPVSVSDPPTSIVLQLHKYIYGFCQAARIWYQSFDTLLATFRTSN